MYIFFATPYDSLFFFLQGEYSFERFFVNGPSYHLIKDSFSSICASDRL